MKKLIVMLLILSMSDAHATFVNPLPTVKGNLEAMLKTTQGRKTISEMKKIANDRNVDVDVAFENYIIAKKNVSVARAQFNPLTTGHLLGMAMGLSYFWAPIAIEAVLSIPTKIYNVSKNKYLEKAALYNLYDARDVLSNELAHLYYDILTHEVILKTIDQEVQILSYQQQRWIERNFPADRIADLKKWILRLNMERVDIYNMYASELAAIRTLISTTDANKYELAQVESRLSKGLTYDLDQRSLQNYSLLNSDKHKMAINMERASMANVKSVKWSILSFSGLNLSYKRKVQEAKNEGVIAALRREGIGEEVKTKVLLELHKLESAVAIASNYSSISDESLQMLADSYEAGEMGQMSEDSVIETALGAIRDFRSNVVAHYSSWSSYEDFATASNYDFTANPKMASANTVQGLIESNPLYRMEDTDFRVAKKTGFNSFTLSLNTQKKEAVAEVDYIFANKSFPNRSNDNEKSNFAVTLQTDEFGVPVVSGVAIVTLTNGHQFNIKFKL